MRTLKRIRSTECSVEGYSVFSFCSFIKVKTEGVGQASCLDVKIKVGSSVKYALKEPIGWLSPSTKRVRWCDKRADLPCSRVCFTQKCDRWLSFRADCWVWTLTGHDRPRDTQCGWTPANIHHLHPGLFLLHHRPSGFPDMSFVEEEGLQVWTGGWWRRLWGQTWWRKRRQVVCSTNICVLSKSVCLFRHKWSINWDCLSTALIL